LAHVELLSVALVAALLSLRLALIASATSSGVDSPVLIDADTGDAASQVLCGPSPLYAKGRSCVEAIPRDRICQGDAMTTQSVSNRSLVPGAQHGARRVWLGMAIVGTVLVVAITGCLFAALALLRPSARRTHEVHMTTDTMRGTVMLAERIRAEGRPHHLDIVLTAKEYGTLDALDEVDSPSENQFALVVGGVTNRDYPHVRTVAALANEHLHLLVKRELAEQGIFGLNGKRIALGPPTTASYHVASDVLNFVGSPHPIETKSGGYSIDPMTHEQGVRELARIASLEEPARAEAIARLPDAIMFLAPLPSPLARQLVTSFGYKLAPLPFAEAYGLDRLNPPSPEGVRVDRSMLKPGVIPAYTYGSNPAEPVKECPTICVPLILVAQDDADPEAVFLLLETLYESPLTTAFRLPALNEQVNAFPRHSGTERYLHRHDPLVTPEVAYRFGTLAGGMGAFLSGAIALYSFLRLRNLRRFESYYRDIGQIEGIARGLEDDPAAPTDVPSLRAHLERRLTTLKCKVLEDFAAGGLRGEGLMAGIIALINDTRESLAGMVAVGNEARQSPVHDNVEQT
jgi:TRAP-type uncharacterized transport system substrate-binding protein